jgi:hypothetical protein
MPKYKDREEFLDALYDHVFPEGEDVTDDDETWFNDVLSKFFDDDSGNSNSGNSGGNSQGGNANAPRRRRNAGGGNSNAPRRRRRQSADSGSGFGSSVWFGN